MSIRGELNKSADYLRNARKAILGRGGEISLTAGLKDLPKAIYNIPSGASLAYQSDTSVAYQKIVPVGSQEFAQVAKIGGMTYKCPVTNYLKITGTISNQLSEAITINSDGSITILSGDPDSSIKGAVELDLDFEAPSGDYYFFATGDDISEGVTVSMLGEWFDEDANNWDGMLLELGSRISGSSLRFSQLIVDFGDGDGGYGYGTPLTFRLWLAKTTEGIFEGLRDTKVTELVSEGANLIPRATMATSTKKGITGTVNLDGSITLNGISTETGNAVFYIYSSQMNIDIPSGIYTLPALEGTSSTSYYFDYYFVGESGASKTQTLLKNPKTINLTERQVKFNSAIVYVISQIGEVVNKTFYPMLNRGSTAAPYKPYRADAVDTLAIAEEIRAIEGYGRGINAEYYNYIDGERKFFVQNTYRKIFDGTETFTSSVAAEWIVKLPFTAVATLSASTKIIICNHYTPKYKNENYAVYFSGGGNQAVFFDDRYTTVDEWKAYLAQLYESGNPLVIEYALATPIETDISSYLPSNFISVEGGGAITFVNEFEQKAPSTINYIFETEGA